MNNFFNKIKKLFPIPSLQKRYLILGALAYVLFKLYVIHTPTKEDDDLPDKVRAMVLGVLAENQIVYVSQQDSYDT